MATWNVVGCGPIGPFASMDAAIEMVEKERKKSLALQWNIIFKEWELRDPERKKYAVMATLHCDEAQCMATLADGLKEARDNTVDGLGEWEPIRSEPHYNKWEPGNVCY
jgi:hypothetical protein